MGEVAGVEVPIVWRGRRARAFVPMLLAQRDLRLSDATVVRAARATADIEHAAEQLPEDYAALARLLLRAEGIASSYIEGVAAPVVDVVLAEDRPGLHTPAAWVAANLAALSEAVAAAAGPLTVEVLCAWHRTLMSGTPTPARYVGVIRTEQGWIGGTNPLDAHLVTPPPQHLPALLDDLVAYANRDDVDPVVQAAVSHAQFELIHPFGDGNGRVGRVLISWLLARRLALLTPPPVSTRLAADVGGYATGLTLFRLGQHDGWVRWFADAVSGAGRAQQELVTEVNRLRAAWQERLAARRGRGRRLRTDSSAWRVLDLLPRRLVLTAAAVATELAVPAKTAQAALRELVAAGVLDDYGERRGDRGRPATRYVSNELLGVAGAIPLRR